MTSDHDDGASMSPESFGLLLQDVLRDLPPNAEPFVKGVAFEIADQPTDGSRRLSDWTGSTHPKQYSRSWPRPGNLMEPNGKIVLYRLPILEAGLNTSQVLRDVILRSIEGQLGVDSGSLEREIGSPDPFWTPDADAEADNTVEDPAAPEPGDALVEIAESELELLTVAERDWFDDVEIAALERPEAEGDPRRLADFPLPHDDPKALVFYTANILGMPDPPVETIRGILREATRRAGVR